MKAERLYSVLEGFDYNLLDEEGFKEDSVREEIILPILKGLGYSASKPFKIHRGKKLLHPFVSIGSARKKIEIIPDYVLEVNNKYAWILEAKSPDEEIVNSKHTEQAYSYAINSEIRVPYFALCNGREFILYHISKEKPVIQFEMILIPSYWKNLQKLLSPENVLDYDDSLSKDLGLHLRRLGFEKLKRIIFPDVPIQVVARLKENLYTFGSGVTTDEGSYLGSFDFDSNVMKQLKGKIPENAFDILTIHPFNENEIVQVNFANVFFRVNIDCQVGDKYEENDREIFLPFRVNKFIDL